MVVLHLQRVGDICDGGYRDDNGIVMVLLMTITMMMMTMVTREGKKGGLVSATVAIWVLDCLWRKCPRRPGSGSCNNNNTGGVGPPLCMKLVQ